MLNNIKKLYLKSEIFAYSFEVNLIITYLCTRFQK